MTDFVKIYCYPYVIRDPMSIKEIFELLNIIVMDIHRDSPLSWYDASHKPGG